MKVVVGSKNPVKISATRSAFSHYFENVEVVGVEVKSGVSHQPVGNETFKGAFNRAMTLKNSIEGDFFVGIEGGVSRISGVWFSFGAVCIVDKNLRVGWGTSPMFTLPDFIVEKLLAGVELGDVMDELLNDHNSKQKQGAIGYLSKGIIDRAKLYESGIIMALVPFLNEEWYFRNQKSSY